MHPEPLALSDLSDQSVQLVTLVKPVPLEHLVTMEHLEKMV